MTLEVISLISFTSFKMILVTSRDVSHIILCLLESLNSRKALLTVSSVLTILKATLLVLLGNAKRSWLSRDNPESKANKGV